MNSNDETFFKMATLAAMQAIVSNKLAYANDPVQLGKYAVDIAAGVCGAVDKHLKEEREKRNA